ncbi:hypothetical protein FRB90_003267 [Tulasnella sp. 427]|nr:hypothetical protein FRB90_003267 [Tulasnella sp. 427]
MSYVNLYKPPVAEETPIQLSNDDEPVDMNFCLPVPEQLSSERVKLVPFVTPTPTQPALHRSQLIEGVTDHPELYTYLPYGPFHPSDPSAFNLWYEQRIRSDPTTLLFAIIDTTLPSPASHPSQGGSFAGVIAYLLTSPTQLCTEIGHIVILPKWQRTFLTTNAVGLLLMHALEVPVEGKGGWGLRRVQWQANAENAPSASPEKINNNNKIQVPKAFSIMSDLSIFDTSIREPLDAEYVKSILSAPPFLQIPGLPNARSLPLPTSQTRGAILRSGETNHTTPAGATTLARQLGITKVFDLRSDKERAKFGEDKHLVVNVPEGLEMEVVCVPALPPNTSDDLRSTFGRFGSRGDEGFVEFYKEVLESGKEAFRKIFEFVRDEVGEGKGCLIHCTGGKDRTGVAAMLMLDLAGVPDDEIIKDYTLTRVGVEPMRELMGPRFKALLSPGQDADPALVAATLNAMSSRPSVMRATLDMLRKDYGGARGYLKDGLAFSEEDVDKIAENLSGGSKA